MNSKSDIIDTVIHGDARIVCERIADGSIQSIVTSPPYFGHRKYTGDDASELEIGRESSVDEYVNSLVSAFESLKPKLSESGLLWLNIGDTYRDKLLLGVPWRVAFALIDKGWILRSDIIWKKPNAMPSSVTSRPTTDHEYIFLFSKSKNYYYDADAIREPHVTFSENSKMKGGRGHFGKDGGTPEQGKNAGNSNLHDGRWDQAFHPNGRNKRTVWEIPLSKFRDSHFAVFPEKLARTCILASTKKGDVVLDPFTGSGTTGVVARKTGRHFIGIDLVQTYAEMAQKRIDLALVKYVGDSRDIGKRVRQHCTGNVESSALRKRIATEMGFEIISTKRTSGSRKISTACESDEFVISEYIQSGSWRVITCGSSDESRDFQWYVIRKLRPPLNKNSQKWDEEFDEMYQQLLKDMVISPNLDFENTEGISRAPGVYSFWHEQSPPEFIHDFQMKSKNLID